MTLVILIVYLSTTIGNKQIHLKLNTTGHHKYNKYTLRAIKILVLFIG